MRSPCILKKFRVERLSTHLPPKFSSNSLTHSLKRDVGCAPARKGCAERTILKIMFLGEFSHNLDSKGRVTIPAKFRHRLMPGLVVTRNPTGGCLMMMPLEEWQNVAARVSALPLIDQRTAQLRRALFSAAEDLKPDRQGRILISQRLREFAGIKNEVIIAGMNTYIELWDPAQWEEQMLTPMQFGEDLFAALGV